MATESQDRRIARLLEERAWLRALSRSLVDDPASAEDLEQATFAAVIAHPPREVTSARGFLGTVVRRLTTRRFRDDARRARRETVAAQIAATTPESAPADEIVAQIEAQSAVVRAVVELAEPYRTTILLRYFRDQSPALIAEVQGVPVGTVETRLRRGLDRLRQELDRRFGARRVWLLPLAGTRELAVHSTFAGVLAMSALFKSLVAVAALLCVTLWLRGLAQPGDGDEAARSSPERPASVAVVSESQTAATPPIERQIAASPPVVAEPELAVIELAVIELAVIELVDERGQPVTASLVFEHAGALENETTDEMGRASFAPRDEWIDLYVFAHHHVATRERVELTAGTHRVTLRDGAVVSLRVSVDGLPAPAGIDIGFDWTGSIALPPDLPPRFQILMNQSSLSAATDASGVVVFSGLPADAHGSVRCADSRFRIVSQSDASRFVVIERPGDRVELELEALPLIRGRVVDHAGNPAPDVALWIDVATDSGSETKRAFAREDGRFESSQWEYGAGRALCVRAVDRKSGERAILTGRAMTSKLLELGDLVLGPGEAITFRVQDEAGQPLVGAIAFDPWVSTASAPTDPQGVGTCFLHEEEQRVGFTAPGYELAVREVARTQVQPIEATLRASAAIEIVNEAGKPCLQRLALEVTGVDLDFLASPRDLEFAPEQMFLLEAQPSIPSYGCHQEPASAKLQISLQNGPARLPRLRPGVAFDLRVRDENDRVLLAEKEIVLAPGETRRFIARQVDARGQLSVRVVDTAGRSISMALLLITEANGDGRSEITDERGIAALRELVSGPLEIEALIPGFAPKKLRGVDPRVVGPEFVLTLEPARTVELEIVDEQGRPVEGLEPAAFADEADSESYFAGVGNERGKGRYVFECLPPHRSIPFSVVCGGGTHRLVHDSPASQARLTIRTSRSIEVEIDDALRSPREGRIVVDALDDRGASLGRATEHELPAMASSLVISGLASGRYRVTMVGAFEAGRRTPLSAPVELRVEAQPTTRVRLTRQ